VSDWSEELAHINQQADRLDFGDARTALREQAVRLADHHQDLDAAFTTRIELVSDATFSGQSEKALVAFAWCEGQCKRDPVRFAEERLGWSSKHVVENVLDFVQIPRAQIDRVMADFEARWQRLGYSMRTVHMFRLSFAEHYGTDTKAHAAAWLAARRDSMSHCRACEVDILVGHCAETEQHERAFEVAAPILERRLSCAEVPHRTYAKLLPSALALGRLDEAAALHRKGYRLLRTGNLQQHVADHMLYCSRIGRAARALDMFEEHLPRMLERRDVGIRMRFLLAADVVLRLLKPTRKSTLRVRLPAEVTITAVDSQVERDALHGWVKQQATDLVARFDARNGTDRFARLAASYAALEPIATPTVD
jgi:hypothetical protein